MAFKTKQKVSEIKGFIMNAQDNTLVIARYPNAPDLIGVVVRYESADGIEFPTFHVEAGDSRMPLVYLVEGAGVEYELLDMTLGQFLDAQPHREGLASFFRAVCERMGWGFNLYVMASAVWHMEQAGVTAITDENAQQAADLCAASWKLVTDYCQAMKLDGAAPSVN